MESIEEKRWILAAMDGDNEAFHKLIEANYKTVERFARQIGAHDQDIQDLVQEVFIRVFRFLPKYSRGKFTTWLYSITYNVTKDHYRKASREKDKLKQMMIQKKDAFFYQDDLGLSEDAAILHQSLQSLDEKYRLPLVLFYLQESSIKEIAHILNINESTVKTRLKRGRERLKNALEKGGLHNESRAF